MQVNFKTKQNRLLELQIDTELINLFRTFKHDNHQFEDGFIEKVYTLLSYYRNSQDSEVFNLYAESRGNLSIEEITLAVHFTFASFNNLEVLSQKLEDKNEIQNLLQENLNTTNILSIHSIFDLKQSIDHTKLSELKNTLKPKYLSNFKVIITEQDPETAELKSEETLEQQEEKQTKKTKIENEITLQYDLARISIHSKGKLDLFFSSYVANLINELYDINLYHYTFQFLSKQASESVSQSLKTYTQKYSQQFLDISHSCLRLKFGKEEYLNYREKLISYRLNRNVHQYDETTLQQDLEKTLLELQNFVQNFIISRNQINQHYIEKLLIGMLGHPIREVRNYAVKNLNMIYDGIDWQMESSYTVKVSNVTRKFQIHYLIESSEEEQQDIYIQLKSNIFIPSCKQSIMSLHKPEIIEFKKIGDRRFVRISLDLGRFTRCGFYDWRLVRVKQDNFVSVYKITEKKEFISEDIKGRFIVHPSITRNLQVHEVFVDLQNKQDEKTDNVVARGNFKSVEDSLTEYKNSGINCLYLMGALERDNLYKVDNEGGDQVEKVGRPEASPLAITCRNYPCRMLGGEKGFKSLTGEAEKKNVKIIVDCLTRVSSSRMHQKYKKYTMKYLDNHGKLVNVYGTDGRAVHFEDTTLLNYRKKKCWDLLLTEIHGFTDKYGIQGVHLDDGQSWPQIFKMNEEELYRKEVDGKNAYTSKQIFEGIVVEDVEDHSGYWGSDLREILPNPFLIKICRYLWQHYPEFLIVSECWGKMGGFSDARELSIINSGPIPRLFKFPLAISQFFGKNLRKDGTINYMKEPKSVGYFKRWYENANQNLPEGSQVIQSTTYHTFPYPSLLYKKGTWAAVDLVYSMPDIPMTFIGEREGKVTKVKITNFYETLKVESKKMDSIYDNQSVQDNENSSSDAQSQRSSLFSVQLGRNASAQKYKKVDADFFYDNDNAGGQLIKSESRKSSYLRLQDLNRPSNEELNIVSQEGWGFIESLKDIKYHYNHRSYLRDKKLPLKRGKFIPLNCELQFDKSTMHSHVLTFARFTKKEIGIIAINFNDGPITGQINFENLQKFFPNFQSSNTVFEFEDWINPEATEKYNHYFASEVLTMRFEMYLNNFQSMIVGYKIHINDPKKVEIASKHSNQRFVQNLQSQIPAEISGNDVATQLYKLVKETDSLQVFVNGFSQLYKEYFQNVELNNLISLIKHFKDDNVAKNKLFTYFQAILKLKEKFPEIEKQITYFNQIAQLMENNNLGPICIATPEYGKYTKTGGLGVMTDELSRGMAELGEEVYVITPMYEDKIKKNPKLLEDDGILYWKDWDCWIGGEKYTVSIHKGVVKGVNIFFLFNPFLFPEAFCGDSAQYVFKQLVLYARSTLQILCDINVVPSIMVTNDWFSALISAYIRQKAYSSTFDTTKCFHICHNLDETYEGRQYPKPDEQLLNWIHEVNNDWLYDKTWDKVILNPSRCALMTCDNWGTVSHSYKYELLQKSPLRPILATKPNAFSFPNGLNRKERYDFIVKATGNDHLKAKEQLQKKYFGMRKLNNKIPLFGFVGRITEQKGIHLVLDGFQQLLQETNNKIQIIVGGMCNYKEEYSAYCANRINQLKKQFPNNFWGDPDLFFRDGPLLNSGCDFGLMPSKFEPGGIVQHEFFIASTPVVATKTGGLQDTVYEYNFETKKGTGFVFQNHNTQEMGDAIKRSIAVFKKQEDYKILRQNAFEGAIDVSDVSTAYAMEFYRMCNKNYLDRSVMDQIKSGINLDYDPESYQPKAFVQKQSGIVLDKLQQKLAQFNKIIETELSDSKKMTFQYRPKKGTFPRIVQIMGSFDDWNQTYDLKYDQFSRVWKISLSLKPGDYMYKYRVDDVWLINDDESKDQDQFNNINNVLRYDQFSQQY